jgi:hypothetical protein
MRIETVVDSFGRRRLDTGDFHIRPGLLLDSLHLRGGSSQSSANQLHLRHLWQ